MPSEEQLQRMDDFLQEEVRMWTAYLEGRIRAAYGSAGYSNELIGTVASQIANEGLQRAKTELAFDPAARYADMGAGRMYNKGAYYGDRDARGRQMLIGRKGSKVYSRTAYGTLNGLMEAVANKYLEQTPELLKTALTNGLTN